ncbi:MULTISPECIES: fluoride efflux transporter CrcB [unclassified Acinetobacter]|uniref:fluoride efflux transporter CrcB n=1 Tax=unclassified Acinetobacter TaxID=196816 RepID=UPI0035BB3619
MLLSLLSIAIGATLGAWLRWGIGLKLNPILTNYPLGTLSVNLLGGFIIGFAMAYFQQNIQQTQLKLLVMTGFCGGLTTFSTFSVEIWALIDNQQLFGAIMLVILHVVGSLLFTALGIFIYRSLFLN